MNPRLRGGVLPPRSIPGLQRGGLQRSVSNLSNSMAKAAKSGSPT